MTGHWTIFSSLRSKARRGIWLEALAVLAATFVVYLAVTYAIDRQFRLEWPFRFGLLAALLWFLGRALYQRLIRPIRVELSDDEMALAVERREPAMRQELISALQFDRRLVAGVPADYAESTELMTTVVTDVKSRVSQMPVHRALERGRVAKFAMILVASLALIVVAASFLDLGLWAKRNLFLSAEEWPRYTKFEWQVEQTRVPQGDPLKLQVAVSGPLPDQVFLTYEFQGGDSGTEAMSQTGNDALFSFEMESVLESMTVQVEGGDGLSERLEIIVVERPRVEDLAITLHYPDYMGREANRLETIEGDIRLPVGCRVEVDGRSHKPITEAFLLIGQGDKVTMERFDDHSFRGSVSPEASTLLTVDVVDTDGLGAGRPPKVYLRLADDQAPRVDFRTDGIGNLITNRARIPGNLKLKDDFGLRSVSSDYRIAGHASADGGEALPEQDPTGLPWERAEVSGLPDFQAGAELFETSTVLDLKPWLKNPEDEEDPANPLRPGQLISLRFRAVDNFGPGDPHVGQSEILTFRVVTSTKLIEELMRRQVEQRHEATEILTAEIEHLSLLREILNPTSDDPRASKARAKLRAMSREQKALGRRVMFVAERYAQIVAEYRNNRILDSTKAGELTDLIVKPLEGLAENDFPTTAREVQRFAASGDDALRSSAVAGYDKIVQSLERVIRNMQDAEDLAQLVEALRQVIKIEESAIEGVKERLEEAGANIFGGAGTDPDKGQTPDDPDKAPENKSDENKNGKDK